MRWPLMDSARPYRTDIDGLRALAVLPVVAFHAEILKGGFVGVDVFFVISGYLIGSNLLADLSAGRFSLGDFYQRRVRRLFPALLVMLLVSSLAALRYLLPAELEDYARSLLAATFSASNLYFWAQSGYFTTPAETKPLLHT